MKAVVLEVQGSTAAALCEDGTVRKVHQKCTVGETIEIKENKENLVAFRRPVRTLAAVAGILLAIFLSSGYYRMTSLAYTYVSLDVNPSIEYTLNRQNKVLSVEGINEDGIALCEKIAGDIQKKEISEALIYTLEQLYLEEYLTEGESGVVLVSVAGEDEDKVQTLSETLSQTIAEYTETAVEQHVLTATVAERETARENGISTGRYVLMQSSIEKEQVILNKATKPDNGAEPEGATESNDTGNPGELPERAYEQEQEFTENKQLENSKGIDGGLSPSEQKNKAASNGMAQERPSDKDQEEKNTDNNSVSPTKRDDGNAKIPTDEGHLSEQPSDQNDGTEEAPSTKPEETGEANRGEAPVGTSSPEQAGALGGATEQLLPDLLDKYKNEPLENLIRDAEGGLSHETNEIN